MNKEKIVEILQREWNLHKKNYSEEGFKEYIEEYCENHFEDGYFINEDGEAVYIIDYVLNCLDLSR